MEMVLEGPTHKVVSICFFAVTTTRAMTGRFIEVVRTHDSIWTTLRRLQGHVDAMCDELLLQDECKDDLERSIPTHSQNAPAILCRFIMNQPSKYSLGMHQSCLVAYPSPPPKISSVALNYNLPKVDTWEPKLYPKKILIFDHSSTSVSILCAKKCFKCLLSR